MPNTGASVHNVVYDARRQRFEGAVSIGNAPDVNVSVPGHHSWGYRRITKAMISASNIRNTAARRAIHDHS